VDEALKETGGDVLPLDVTNEADLKHVVQTIHAAQGRIDVVANSGFGLYGAAEDVLLPSMATRDAAQKRLGVQLED
jgi:NAD(P)-dependent dehydrogenase (short-subunit alcohol dehydrogenase family)